MAAKKRISVGHIAEKAIELLEKHPKGLSMRQMREMIPHEDKGQEHFSRRIREIRKIRVLETHKRTGETIYVIGGPSKRKDSGVVSSKLRAAVLHAAHGRCQMCGKTIKEDGAKLQADHKVPHSWGGVTTPENLWAICNECNHGKQAHFNSIHDDAMMEIVEPESVHERIALLLKHYQNKPVPDYLIEFVANIRGQQLEWRKRLRELRYPPIGLIIDTAKKRAAGGAVRVQYTLRNWIPLPPNHVALIRQHEKETKEAKQSNG